MTLGIDQSLSNTGICIIKDDKIIHSSSIPTSNDLIKTYTKNKNLKISETEAFKSGLLVRKYKCLCGTELTPKFELTKKKKDLTEEEKELLKVSQELRMDLIIEEIKLLLSSFNITKVNCEGISFGGSGMVISLAILLGRIQQTVKSYSDASINIIPPSAVKKFAGKGNASKEEMENFVSLEDLEILKKSCPVNKNRKFIGLDDRVDAYWIAKYKEGIIK